MNDLAKFTGGVPANPEDLVTGLQNVNQSIQGSLGGTPLLRLLKAGYFVYGPENIEVEEGSTWAVNPHSIHHGYAAWDDGELVDERMVPFNTPLPNAAELPDVGCDWRQQISMFMQCMSGEDQGTTVLYKGTSKGLLSAFKDLVDALIVQLQSDKVNYVPVLELNVDSYRHKKHGDVFFPVLDIMEWISMEGIASGEAEEGAEEPESEPEPEPAPSGRRKRGGKRKDDDVIEGEVAEEETSDDEPPVETEEAPEPAPARRRRGKGKAAEEPAAEGGTRRRRRRRSGTE